MVILDMETDGLMPYCTKIHCAVAYDIEKDKWYEFTPESIYRLPLYLDTVAELSMHNGVGFDLRVFKKILNYDYKGLYRDTLLMSRILWPDIEKPKYLIDDKEFTIKSGPHSVEAWGIRFGIAKPQHEDWTKYSPEMLHRCREDVKIQTELYKKCIKEMEKYSIHDPRISNNTWNRIIEMEQYFWKGMEKQAENGWLFNINDAAKLRDDLEDKIGKIDRELEIYLPLNIIKPYKDKECKALKKDGTITTHALSWLIENNCKLKPEGDFCRVQYQRTDLNSPNQLKDFLLRNGWIPKDYNFKRDKFGKPAKDEKGKIILTSPKIPKEAEDWEYIANQMSNPAIALLAERGKAAHRLASLKGFIESTRFDNRLEAQMNSCGTNTARARHSVIVNIPKAEENVYLGKEFRSLFICPENKVIVGADAAALEARCEAHYVYKFDKAAAWELLNGDIHTANAEAWGVQRSKAKNGKYALLYGCGGSKLATTIGKDPREGDELVKAYWGANPGLARLVKALEAQFETKGYLLAIDGRPLTIRYKHALLNTLLQSCGSIAMKIAWCIFDKWRKRYNIACFDVGNFHDELQVECDPSHADAVGLAIVESIKKAGEYLKLNVPLDGEYKIGKSWAETH